MISIVFFDPFGLHILSLSASPTLSAPFSIFIFHPLPLHINIYFRLCADTVFLAATESCNVSDNANNAISIFRYFMHEKWFNFACYASAVDLGRGDGIRIAVHRNIQYEHM